MVELLSFQDGPVVYGITLRNSSSWTARGWTLLPADDVSIDDAKRCRTALAEQLGFDSDKIIVPFQVHGTTVAVIDDSSPEKPADALVTSAKGLLLCVSVADCVGVVIWDSSYRVIAVVHSGWRGSAGEIVIKCIKVIGCQFGIEPTFLRAWLSPCASGRNYIVRNDVARLFPNFVVERGTDQYLFDNQAVLRYQLQQAGLANEAITTSLLCTIEDTRFHSYRRDGDKAGRMAVFIGFRE